MSTQNIETILNKLSRSNKYLLKKSDKNPPLFHRGIYADDTEKPEVYVSHTSGCPITHRHPELTYIIN